MGNCFFLFRHSANKISSKVIIQLLIIICISIQTKVNAQLPGFVLTGDPENINGATWTYQDTINSVIYNLTGILFKPVGTSTYPSVIINHGTGGNTLPGGYSDKTAKEIVTWGYVCIATNACHSSGVPCGSPGLCDTSQWGARTNNFLRSMACWNILASLSYTDTNCIGTFGHSRGAFLTTGLAATYPNKFSCAGHTAGGVPIPFESSMPTLAMANNVSSPYIQHHGTADAQVPIIHDDNLDSILSNNGVTHQYFTYLGYTHIQTAYDSVMYARTKSFFDQYMCSGSSGFDEQLTNLSNPLVIIPNPASTFLQSRNVNTVELDLYNLSGQILLSKTMLLDDVVDITFLSNGIYYLVVKTDQKTSTQKLIISK